jgi:hypothetical protein
MPPPAAVYVFGGCVSAPATAGCVSAVRAAGPGPGVAEWDAYAAPREYSVSQSWPRPTVQCIAGLVFGRQEFSDAESAVPNYKPFCACSRLKKSWTDWSLSRQLVTNYCHSI